MHTDERVLLGNSRLTTIKRVRLGSHHHVSLTKHTTSDAGSQRDFPPFVELAIAGCPGGKSCYLFHVCADGQVADTWHETVEGALNQAEWEFGVKPQEWIVPSSPETW